MQEFCLHEAALACGGTLFAPGNLRVTSVVIDSRKADPGALFVPIRGERFDGHAFMEAALSAGACCTLSEHPLDPAVPHIRVADTGRAFLDLAGYYKSRFPGLKTVGITGSVGKTTTKECVASALAARFRVLKNEGNLNNQTGVPLTLFRLMPEDQAAVIEMGTNHFGEIESLARAVRPDICLFTNIGEAHIEHFGSREGILRGKTEMLAHMAPGGRIILNGDDDMLIALKKAREDVITFGLGAHNSYQALDVEDDGLLGLSFTVLYENDARFRLTVPAPGMHMVYNGLAAFAVGRALGMRPEEIQKGLLSYAPVGGRMSISQGNGLTVINDTYNASPAAMKAALDVLQKASGRKVCVLGDMLELGERGLEYHRDVGAYAASCGVDVMLCAGTLARGIYEGAQEAGAKEAHYFPNREALLFRLTQYLQPGDTVLVKASHSMGFDAIVDGLLEEYA